MIYTVTLNPAIDLVVRLDGPLQAGTVNRAAGEEYVLGGKGVNVSGVLAELGCPSVALGFVAGATGVWLEQGLAARGLRTDFIRLPAGMTRINLKLKDGRETEINGAGPTVPPEALDALLRKLDALQSGDVLVLAGSLPAGFPPIPMKRCWRGWKDAACRRWWTLRGRCWNRRCAAARSSSNPTGRNWPRLSGGR